MTTGWYEYRRSFRSAARDAKKSEEYISGCLKYAQTLYRQGLPIIFDSGHFSKMCGVRKWYLYACANKSKSFYRSFIIPKRNGAPRVILEPLPSLKLVQRFILDNILYRVPVSKCAKAFVKHGSTKKNALLHRKQSIVLRLDIENFFPSIQVDDVFKMFRSLGYESSLAGLFSSLCCHEGFLPQGAPTSPMISNIIMRNIDEKILAYCRRFGIRYTRYADDLCFSGDFNPGRVIAFVRNILERNGFRLNSAKTIVMRKGNRQNVTGIVVNEKLQVPREMRRKLRQELYYIKAFGFNQHVGNCRISDFNYHAKLLGLARYILQISPNDRDAQELVAHLYSLNLGS